jgi:F-type H+-transporting ATPase subunit epsilon
MRLRVFLPARVLLDEPVAKVIAEAENGSFCLLPRHADFAAALVPGLLAFVTEAGREEVAGVDEGTLVKCGDEVLVSTLNGVRGRDLATLRDVVERRFRQLDEREQAARSALARLEAGVVRRMTELVSRPG